MNSYNTFAQFYDRLTENVDYKVRCKYISDLFLKYNDGTDVLDLACGTGTLSRLLCNKGYNVTGMDMSEDMLTVAENKCGGSVRLLKGDMTCFSLYNEFDFCVCSLDSINHIDNIEKVKSCFSCVHNSLREDGIFIFDVNTVYKHKYVLGGNTFAFDEEDFFLCWDNEYSGEGKVRILLDFFVFNGKNYDRYSEELFETAYGIDVLKSALSEFEILGIYDELTENPPRDDSERIYFVCRRK